MLKRIAASFRRSVFSLSTTSTTNGAVLVWVRASRLLFIAQEYIAMGALNGLFVLGRSMGFIGHYLDQKRLKQGLYRHPTDDIAYMVGQEMGDVQGN